MRNTRSVLYSEVSRLVLSRRRDVGMTQEELSKKSGVSRVTIMNLELMKKMVGMDSVEKIADGLGCSVHVELKEKRK